MRFVSLFSGIGGLDLGLERAGHTCIGQVEIDPICRKVLARHWPDVPRHDDVCTYEPPAADMVVGGFPCQPFSRMGEQKGSQDERFLWPQFARVLERSGARWAVIENVRTLLSIEGGAVFRRVLADLRDRGCDAWWRVFSAAEFGHLHLRQRVIVVAHPPGFRMERVWQAWHRQPRTLVRPALPDGPGHRLGGAEPDLVRAVHGLSGGLVRSRRHGRFALRALGNAVVPALGECVGQLIHLALAMQG